MSVSERGFRQQVERRPVTRRNFIVWYLGGLLTALVAAVIAPILVYIWPPAGQTKQQVINLTLSTALDEIKEGTAVLFQAPSATGFVMTDGGGDNYPGKIGFKGFLVNYQGTLIMLSATCSHLGCQVNQPSGTPPIFQCPCHGSQFNLNGTVHHGPAVAPLSHYAWKATGPNKIAVIGVSLPGVG